jgi:hypothetical protein
MPKLRTWALVKPPQVQICGSDMIPWSRSPLDQGRFVQSHCTQGLSLSLAPEGAATGSGSFGQFSAPRRFARQARALR